MTRSEAQWLSLTDAFYTAALDGKGWYNALDAFATATGSRNGELVCVGPNATTPVNIMTNVEPGMEAALEAAGGLDPSLNPRISAGMKAPVLRSMTDEDFITPEEIKRHPHYQEFLIPWDIPFICATVLERTEGLMIGIAVIRSSRQGPISEAQRVAFEAIAPHVRTAVRTQMALEGQGTAVLAGALDALSLPAFLCDAGGIVRKHTPAAEELLLADRGLQLRQGQLHAANPADVKPLKDAIDAMLFIDGRPQAERLQTVVLHHEDSFAPSLVLDVIALPSGPFDFRFAPRVLVVARGERGREERRRTILQTAWALTSAESDIALQVSAGRTPEAVAAGRGVSVATVRTQIKAIMAKLGVSRQIELALKVSAL